MKTKRQRPTLLDNAPSLEEIGAKGTVQNGEKRAQDAPRDSRGRVRAGNKLAAGPRVSIQVMRDAFAAAVSPEDLQAIARAIVGRARRGDVRAASLVLDRVLGRLPVAIGLREIDGANALGENDDYWLKSL